VCGREGDVHLRVDDDGGVGCVAVDSRTAGIGPTLPPSTNAVAIRADPAHAASAGDLVQVWEQAPAKRVLTGELRGVAGDVVTVAIDASDTPKLDPQTQYKLVTLPVQDRSDREFASLLRAADETMGTATVESGSALDGAAVGSLAVAVVAITREDTAPETIPSRNRVLAAGDTIYAIATPDALRRLEQATEGSGDVVTTAAMVDDTEDDDVPEASDPDDRGGQNGEADSAAETTDGEAHDGTETVDAAETVSDDTAETDAVDGPTDTAAADGTPGAGEVADAPVDSGTDMVADDTDSDESSDDDPLAALRDADLDDTAEDLTADETFEDLSGDDGDDTVEVWDPEERITDAEGETAEDVADDSDSADTEAVAEGGDDESAPDDDSGKSN
jgi:hypothetical protein